MVADSTSEPEAGCGGRRRGFKWKLRPIRRNRRHGYRRLRPDVLLANVHSGALAHTPLHTRHPSPVFKYIGLSVQHPRNAQIPDNLLYTRAPLSILVRFSMCIPHGIACVHRGWWSWRIGVNAIYPCLFTPIPSLLLTPPRLSSPFFLCSSRRQRGSNPIYIYVCVSLCHFAFNPLFIATVCTSKLGWC